MFPLGDIFEGEQMDSSYKWGRVTWKQQQETREGWLGQV